MSNMRLSGAVQADVSVSQCDIASEKLMAEDIWKLRPTVGGSFESIQFAVENQFGFVP
jgi:hypothetical protein